MNGVMTKRYEHHYDPRTEMISTGVTIRSDVTRGTKTSDPMSCDLIAVRMASQTNHGMRHQCDNGALATRLVDIRQMLVLHSECLSCTELHEK